MRSILSLEFLTMIPMAILVRFVLLAAKIIIRGMVGISSILRSTDDASEP